MGWGRTLLLGDLGTQMNVTDLEGEIGQIKEYLRSQQTDHGPADASVQALQRENHDLKLYLATLIRLLVSKNILTQEELSRFVNLVDSPDASG